MDEVRDERRYRLDYDWLWGEPPHNTGPEARLRVRLTAEAGATPGLHALVDRWFDSLPDSGSLVRGEAGWAARIVSTASILPDAGVQGSDPAAPEQVVLELWSAGEDVADGIRDATRSLYEGVLRGQAVGVEYEQLPRSAD